MQIPVIPHRDGVFEEVRYAHFMQAIGKDNPIPMKILSFGACNYSCPWCKRNGYRKTKGVIEGSVWMELRDIAKKARQHMDRGYAIRFSGGDPCCFPNITKTLAKAIKKAGGMVSIAHNGSSPEFVEKLIEYTDFWAVDLKSIKPERFRILTGTGRKSEKYLENTLQSIQLISWYDIPLEVRTTVFGDTEGEELERIAEFLLSCENENLFWTLRLYVGKAMEKFKPPVPEDIMVKAKRLKMKYPQLKIGIRSKWDTNKGLIFV
ncbi:radical SAM protein [Anaerocellum danielii]|uniref:Radical SAM protein n=1 Tax=Anaerocellum danielii TaxID=1387557 RepID=A0ABZ0U0H9_9FIRM|nr:radical SAM protein [Caldicellulosiruptor danielii]WPX08208.1 radical SAM protein [Caldicellulosiruptor danielii]